MIPFSVTHDPLAQTVFGNFAEDPGAIEVNALAVITLGFLFGDLWARCSNDESTSWTPKSDETTVWTPKADETTIWSECV